ncbi:MAG: siroheme synthase CysG, partial [Paracoccaceae bacterium]
MDHFPIFLAVAGRRIILSGGGDAAIAKLRLLFKTTAHITVFAKDPLPEILHWEKNGKLALVRRRLETGDALCAALFYAANEDAQEDRRVAKLAHEAGALVNIVDNLQDSQFITPAIVDRDPVTVAIGTEGAAPVLARAIKADLEQRLPAQVGVLARIAKSFRKNVNALPMGRARRRFWSEFYFNTGPRALDESGESGIGKALSNLLATHLKKATPTGHVIFVGAGPGDPELLTLKACKALDRADVVLYDRLVGEPILELARREALLIDVGKTGFGASTPQHEINALLLKHSQNGQIVVRLKGGDATIFGRLDEEIDACEAAQIEWSIVPGITAASAAVAAIGQSLTRRQRNASVRFLTGHDMHGFHEQDWQALAKANTVAAIYMGKKSARFIQGRLLMHGADPKTPVSIVEYASRPNQRIIEARLDNLAETLQA